MDVLSFALDGPLATYLIADSVFLVPASQSQIQSAKRGTQQQQTQSRTLE